MKRIIYAGLMMASLGWLSSCDSKRTTDSKEIAEDQNEAKAETRKDEADAEFAVTAADGGMLEVRLAQLAQSNASSEEVKSFAKTMVADHGKTNDELRAMAQRKDISLPGTLSEKNQEKYDDFAQKHGEEFDKAFCEFMVKDHKDDIDAFEKQARKGTDSDLRSWASSKLPTLEHHLSMAQTLEDDVKAANKRTSSRK